VVHIERLQLAKMAKHCLGTGSQWIYISSLSSYFANGGAIVAVIVWLLDLQLSMQSVLITTDVLGSTPAQGEVYNIM
jgi:hypothetical protein